MMVHISMQHPVDPGRVATARHDPQYAGLPSRSLQGYRPAKRPSPAKKGRQLRTLPAPKTMSSIVSSALIWHRTLLQRSFFETTYFIWKYKKAPEIICRGRLNAMSPKRLEKITVYSKAKPSTNRPSWKMILSFKTITV